MIKEFISVMKGDVMVWFEQLISKSAKFWILVSISHWRLFQMEQLRLCFFYLFLAYIFAPQ